MKILVTGSSGFIAKNLIAHLRDLNNFKVLTFNREHSFDDLALLVGQCDAIVHLAGINRPKDIQDFSDINVDFTAKLCEIIASQSRRIPLIFSSSTQASLSNPYGESKLRAEEICKEFASTTGNPVTIFRLPGVFGKWCQPNYNSVVATFCHNIANNIPIQINDSSACIDLVYVDDVVKAFISALVSLNDGISCGEVSPVHKISLGALANQVEAFKNCRTSLISERVGNGFIRALYATYISYLPPDQFVYDLPRYGDERGIFVEMLKTKDSGQFSYFTALPGVTRGCHYHHTKTEKFLVIKGEACFSFRNIVTEERCRIITSEVKPQVVESIPGWVHDITNIGVGEMLVMLWASEIFDRQNPDTIGCKV